MAGSDRPRLRLIEVLPIEQDGLDAVVLRDPGGVAEEPVLLTPAGAFLATRLDGHHTLAELQAELLQCLGEKIEFILLDLERLASISGAGLRVLVMVNRRLDAEDGDLVLIGLRPEVRKVFEIGGMIERFGFEPSRSAGLRRLHRSAKTARTVDLAGAILRRKGDGRTQRESPDRPARAVKRSSLAVELLSEDPKESGHSEDREV